MQYFDDLFPAGRWAFSLFLLGTVVVSTSLFATREYDGHDFIISVWAPTHALVEGVNPYDPTNATYFQHYPVPIVSGLYVPTALLLHAPLALLNPSQTVTVMAAINAGLMWLGVLMLIPPRTTLHCLVGGVAGSLVLLSASAIHTIELGQLSGWAFAGLALFAASLRANPSATWLPAIGAVLVALKPQSGIPMLLALALLGSWKVFARAALILIATSVPGIVLLVAAAGTLSTIIRTVHDNLGIQSHIPPTDLAAPYNLRIDGLGVLSHLGGPALTGMTWTVIFFTLASVCVAFVLSLSRERWDVGKEPYVVSLVAMYIVISLYHLTYDQIILYVGPLAALGVVADDTTSNRSSRVLAFGGAVLMATGVALRAGFRARLIALGIPALLVHVAWVVTPTLMGLTLIAWVTVLGYREGSRRHEYRPTTPRVLS
jgi:glycosyl transferase family 87